MPNYFVFDTVSRPLYTQQVNTYVSPGIDTNVEGAAARAGILYGVSATTAASNPLALQVSNPAGSGRTMYVSRLVASSATQAATVNLLRNATVSGTALTPVNYNFGLTGGSVMTAASASSSTGSPATLMTMIITAGATVIDLTGRIVVPPGNSLTVSAAATGNNTLSASLSWWEF